jgi:hypothetical protein
MHKRSTSQKSGARWSLAARVAVISAITALLLMPAIYNGFPFVFPDTSAYLSVAYADSWPIDRSGFYGLLLAPVLLVSKPYASVWLAAIVQSAIIALILVTAFRRSIPSSTPTSGFLLIAATALVTTLSWHATQLMPDAFTGALILLVWLAASRGVDENGTLLLWLPRPRWRLFTSRTWAWCWWQRRQRSSCALLQERPPRSLQSAPWRPS